MSDGVVLLMVPVGPGCPALPPQLAASTALGGESEDPERARLHGVQYASAPGTTGSFGCMSEADRRNAFPIVKTGC